jgi:hypothetical protein
MELKGRYLLTHSMDQSSPWEANGLSASQKIPHILWTSKFVTYLLTHSMDQSASWEANTYSASEEIPRILWLVFTVRCC